MVDDILAKRHATQIRRLVDEENQQSPFNLTAFFSDYVRTYAVVVSYLTNREKYRT